VSQLRCSPIAYYAVWCAGPFDREFCVAEMSNHTFGVLEDWPLRQPQILAPYSFEKINLWRWRRFIHETANAPVYIACAYLIVIFGLQIFMKHREPMRMKKLLVVWNAMLSMFSISGFIRMLPELVYLLKQPGGFHASVCIR